MIPLKKQLIQLILIQKLKSNSPKKQTNNELRYHKTLSTQDAKPRKRYRMYPITPLTGIKRHARTPRSDAFPSPRSTYERF